jgi:hypothetical protein
MGWQPDRDPRSPWRDYLVGACCGLAWFGGCVLFGWLASRLSP